MTGGGYAYLLAETLICGAFMAAVGVRASLAFSTATRSMAVAVGIWLVALGVIAALSATTVMVAWMAILVAWWTATGDATFAGPGLAWFPITFQAGFQVVQLALYALLATLVVIECRLRFDRIAGRMAGGALEVAVDRAFHGLPTAPVMIDPTAAERAASAVAIPADGPADLPRRRPRPTRGGGLRALVEVTAHPDPLEPPSLRQRPVTVDPILSPPASSIPSNRNRNVRISRRGVAHLAVI